MINIIGVNHNFVMTVHYIAHGRVAQDRLCSLTVKTQHPVTSMYKSVLYHQNSKGGNKEKASGI